MRDLHLLSSVDSFKLVIEKQNTKNDNILYQILSSSSYDIEAYCKRKLRGRTYGSGGLDAELHNGQGGDKLFTNQYPIISVTSLWDDTLLNYSDTYLKASSDYLVWKDEGIIQLRTDAIKGTSFNSGTGNIKLVYTAGYDHFEIITGVNDKIDFNDGADKIATLTGGVYTANGLSSHIASVMTTASSGTITCTYNYYSSKFKLSSSTGTFELLWESGDNSSTSACRTLGYNGNVDEASLTYYESDYSVLGIPPDLEQACLELTLRRFEESRYGSGRFDINTVQVQGQHAGTTTYSKGALPSGVERVIRKYKRGSG